MITTYIIFLIRFLNPNKARKCGYWLADEHGTTQSKLLASEGVNVTIHGEWSLPKPNSTKSIGNCSEIQQSWIQPARMWFSPYPRPDIGCCKLQLHECGKHRYPDENPRNFVYRVLVCHYFKAKVTEVICRYDKEAEINYISQIVISDNELSQNQSFIGCKESKPFKTTFDDAIIDVSPSSEVLVDTFNSKIYNTEVINEEL